MAAALSLVLGSALMPLAGAAAAPEGVVAAPAFEIPNTRPAWQNLALTPPMGYNNWAYFTYNFDEASLLAQAQKMKDSGLIAAGYDTLTIDDAWMTKDRGPDGKLVVDTAKFPDGMKAFGDKLHALGLKFGIYADAGTRTCGNYAGSLGFEDVDAKQFASFGVDFVKVDGCNMPGGGPDAYKAAYQKWSDALANAGRPMVFSVSAPAYFQHGNEATWHDMIDFSGDIGNMWREGDDIAYASYGHDRVWNSIMNNYNYNVKLPQFAGPGHWNDPDFVMVGTNGLTRDEEQAQFSLYAQMAAPLFLSTDLTALSPDQLATVSNPEVIAINQDTLGAQGYIVQQSSEFEVLTKPLANGDTSVVLFNKSTTARTISTDLKTVGATGTVELRDVWKKQSAGTSDSAISAVVPAHGVAMYRLSKAAVPANQARLGGSGTGSVSSGASGTALVTVSNNGSAAASNVRVKLGSAGGVTPAAASEVVVPKLDAGASATIPVAVTAAAGTVAGTATLTASAVAADGTAAALPVNVTVSASTIAGDSFLSDLKPSAWKLFDNTKFGMDTQFDPSRKIILAGKTYEKGLGGQAGGSVTFDLNGQCTSFSATIGIDDYNLDYAVTHGQPKVWSTFTLTDQAGTVLKNVDFTAPDTAVQPFTANVTGVQRLTIANNNFGANGYYAHANWADAKVTCAGAAAVSAPSVTAHPANATVADGAEATLAAAANGTATSYSWQASRDGGTTWQAVSAAPTAPATGATTATATLKVPASASESGVKYRAVFSNQGGTVASNPATLTVTGPAATPVATTVAATLTDGVAQARPGQVLPYTGTATVGAQPATGLNLVLAASAKAPLGAAPVVTAKTPAGVAIPVTTTLSVAGNVHTMKVNGTLPAGTILTVNALGIVADGLLDGSGNITATLAISADLSGAAVTATENTALAYKAALDSLFTDTTRAPLPGTALNYTSTTMVGRSGFLNAGANYGPAESVTLTLTPDAALPFTAQPTVSVLDANGTPVTVPNTITGAGTNASPYVVTFNAPVPQGTITTKTPATVPAGAAYGTSYTAKLTSNLSNNGRTAAPAAATDVDLVDNAPTVQNTLTADATTIKPGESYNFTAKTKVANGAAKKLLINLYGTPAAPLDDNPVVTAELPNGDNFPVTATVSRSVTAYTVNIHEVVPANSTVTVKGSGTVVAEPATGARVSVRQTAHAVNMGGDPTSIGGTEVAIALQAPVKPSVPLPEGCTNNAIRPTGATASSQETSGENTPASNAIDGSTSTFWGSRWSTAGAAYPHQLILDLGKEASLCGINYVPRQGNSNGRVATYKVYVSNDPTVKGTAVASGSLEDSNEVQTILFGAAAQGAAAKAAPVQGRYVVFEGLSEVASVSTGTMTVAELSVNSFAEGPVEPVDAKATLTNALTAPATVAPGGAIAYQGTVTVGSTGFANPDAIAGPAEELKLTLTPGTGAPFTGAPVVVVRNAAGATVTVASTVTGTGTSASPFVVAFGAPVPQGTVTVTVNATAPASGSVSATLGSELLNNGSTASPKAATAATAVEVTATPTPTPTESATATPTESATPTPTATATPSASATPTPTASATPTPSASATPTASATPSATATPTGAATATTSATPGESPSQSATPTPGGGATTSNSAAAPTGAPSPARSTGAVAVVDGLPDTGFQNAAAALGALVLVAGCAVLIGARRRKAAH